MITVNVSMARTVVNQTTTIRTVSVSVDRKVEKSRSLEKLLVAPSPFISALVGAHFVRQAK